MYGWSVVEFHEANKVYYITDREESAHYAIPEIIWDSLDSAVQRADNYRKSRDHFRESRDTEKQKCSENVDRINAHYRNLHKDLNDFNQMLTDEVSELERSNNFYKTMLWFAGAFGIMCLLSHYII